MVQALNLASTTLPFADRSNSGVVKEAMSLADNIFSSDRTGSLRAGTSGLLEALQGSKNSLCLASDRRTAKVASAEEMNYGDASTAFLVGSDDLIATYLGGQSTAIDFVDHFRETGAHFDYAWEARFVRDEGYQKILGTAIKTTLEALEIDGATIAKAVIATPIRGVPQKLAQIAGIPPEAAVDTLMANIGDTGTSHPLLMLAEALQQAGPGERILLASFGQGADVMVFETTALLAQLNARRAPVVAAGLADSNYLRYLFHRNLLAIDKGMRAELDEKQPGTTLARDRKTVLGLIGGKCKETGMVQFPKSDLTVGTDSRKLRTQEDYHFAERQSKVLSFTADRLTYSPDPPCYYGMVDFEGGGRIIAEFADVEEGEVDVGTAMRMVFRIKAFDEMRGFRKYFWKAKPLQRGDD